MKSVIGMLIIILLLSMAVTVTITVAAKLTYHNDKLSKSYAGSESLVAQLRDTVAPVIDAHTEDYVFVGGQNGTWFQLGQFPMLYQISLQNYSRIRLDPVRSEGTVWGGGFNGSQFMVSGWGSDDNSSGPYIWLYNGAHVVTSGSLDDYGQASSWNGGDIFAASYNGKEWLLSGLGSGPLPPYSEEAINHMSLGIFNGKSFIDLSNLVPDQQDAILYANAWNGRYWLVGGGYLGVEVLFTYDGSKIVDLSAAAMKAIPSIGSVQAIDWNGDYWLIGGIGFLAKYDGRNFVDLTKQLEHALSTYDFNSVNAIAWNGQSWLIGGGTAVAQLSPSHAWFIAYTPDGFIDPPPTLPSYISNAYCSSILGITAVNGVWYLGGYASTKGILLAYDQGTLTDYSNLVSGFTYVDWVSNLQVFVPGKLDY